MLLLHVDVCLYVVNVNSHNKDTAFAYLEQLVTNRDAEVAAILYPDQAEPTLLPEAERWMEDVKKQYAQDVKEGLLPEDATALEERLENIRNMPGHQLVEREKLVCYKEQIYPDLCSFMYELTMAHSHEYIEKLKTEVHRYLNNEITLDQAVGNMNHC